jgi:hypothetical protein
MPSNTGRYRGTRRELYEIGRERRGAPRQDKVKIYFKIYQSIGAGVAALPQQLVNLNATQSELVGLGVDLLALWLDRMAEALGRHDRILPAGVVDLEALYLIWNLKWTADSERRGTTVYLEPGQAVRLGEIRSRLRLQIRVTQAELLNLGLSLVLTLAEQLGEKSDKIRSVSDLQQVLVDFV